MARPRVPPHDAARGVPDPTDRRRVSPRAGPRRDPWNDPSPAASLAAGLLLGLLADLLLDGPALGLNVPLGDRRTPRRGVAPSPRGPGAGSAGRLAPDRGGRGRGLRGDPGRPVPGGPGHARRAALHRRSRRRDLGRAGDAPVGVGGGRTGPVDDGVAGLGSAQGDRRGASGAVDARSMAGSSAIRPSRSTRVCRAGAARSLAGSCSGCRSRCIFAVLFASADPIFRRGLDDVLGLRIDLGSMPGRVLFILAAAWFAVSLLIVSAGGLPAMERGTSLGAAANAAPIDRLRGARCARSPGRPARHRSRRRRLRRPADRLPVRRPRHARRDRDDVQRLRAPGVLRTRGCGLPRLRGRRRARDDRGAPYAGLPRGPARPCRALGGRAGVGGDAPAARTRTRMAGRSCGCTSS